jgi:hypothetical protein
MGLNWLALAGSNPAIYVKGTASVTDNVPSAQISSAQINRFSLPNDAVSIGAVSLAKALFARVTGLDIKSATFSENALNFSGTAPTKVFVQQ